MVTTNFKEATSQKADWVCIGLILILSGLFFLPAIVHPDSIIYPSFARYSDLTVVHWPKAFLIAETFKQHDQLPLWSPLILSGMPLVSNQLAMLFYPPNLLCLFLPVNVVLNGLFVAHIFWAGAGLYFFMRRGLATSVAASFIAALSFMFSGKVLAHVAAGHVSLVAALAWLPWALLCTHLAFAERKLLYSLFAGVSLALQAILHTQILIYTAYTLAAYALFQLLTALPKGNDLWWRKLLRGSLLLASLLLAFLLVGAIQILPLIEMMYHSNRALSLGEASAFSLSWITLLVGLFLPTDKGGHEMVIYLGLVPLGLVPLAWRRKGDICVLFFVGLAVFSLLFALGSHTPFFGFCYYLLPGLRWMRTPTRACFLLALATAVLAGYGFDALTTGMWSIRARKRLTMVGIYVAFSCLLLGAGLSTFYGQVSRATIGLALLPVAGLGLVILNVQGKLNRKGLALTTTLLLLVDLWSFGCPLLLFRSPEQAFAPQREVAEYLAAQEGLFRVYSPSYSLPQHLAARSGLQLVDGVEGIHLWRYDRFIALAGGYPFPGFSVTVPPFPPDQDLAQAHRATRPNLTLLGLLNARFLAAEFPMDDEDLTLLRVMGDTHVYENQRALPRAFVVGQVKAISDEEEMLSELTLFDPKELAILEEEPGWALDDPSLFREAEMIFYSPNKIVVQADLSAPGLLVLSELWYPGWRAYDNGREVKIHRANYLLRGVYLEGGRHTVEFVYEPLSFEVGLWVSAGAVLGLVVYVILVESKRVRASHQIPQPPPKHPREVSRDLGQQQWIDRPEKGCVFAHNRKEDILIATVLFSLVCLFFWPAIVHPNDLIYPPAGGYTDLTITHWPNAFFIAQTVREYGQLPLWRPLIMSGTPFAGNPLSGLFYPFNWLFVVLPLVPTFNALFILHIFIAGLSMYELMRRGLDTGPFAASVAAISFMFTPKLMAHLGAGHVGLVCALSWLPLTLLVVIQAICRRSPFRAALAGGLLALQGMADVRIAFYTALLVALYAVFRLAITAICSLPGRWPQTASLILALLPLPLTFALLGAVQLLPTLELMRHISRGHLTLAEAGIFSLPWRYLLGLLLTNYGGFHEWMTYLGLLPLLLAGFALAASKARRDTLFFGGLALSTALFALGTNAPLFPLLYHLLPGLSWLRVPSRLWFLVALAVAVLAGLGAARLSAGRFGEQTRKWLTLLGLQGIIFAMLLTGGWAAVYPPLPANVLSFGLFLSLGLAVITLHLNGKLRPPLFKAAFLLILVADLWFADTSLLRYVSPKQAFAPQRDVVEYLGAQDGLFRIYSPSYSLPQHLTAGAGLQTVDGVDPSQLVRYVEFMSLAGSYDTSGYGVTIPPFPPDQDLAQAYRTTRPNLTLLGLLNARFLAAEFPMDDEDLTLLRVMGCTHVYENQRALPRAFVVGQVKVISDEEEMLSELTLFDPKELAILEEEPGWALDDPSLFQEAEVIFYSPNEIVVQADLSAPGLLVLSELWYPGWRAYDNGREVKIHRANYLLRSVYLEGGRHTVEFVYEPLSFEIGLWVSAGAVLGLAVYVILVIRRRRE